ncbi:hypothetical protein PV08_03301 [Exophiala spinifera]|uniref:EKC/KEOPS complex subunit CGI121 n=1 Tax=Exophiala spinifera TaxID=91928 RepID=A0A0D1YUU3_9EURO|nr:uncharacterized protein PV08_03301 [Exophiala spinifera]KIW19011.1 hypothetical protein PV08_03301 [Exophiala spinifera]
MVLTIHLAHMPPELALYVSVYTDVENASFLKQQLLAGNAEFEYAFVDASMILSTTHVLAAAFRAMNDYLNDRLRSHNVHSEIVFSLSPNNNIGEAFRRFGISDSTRDLLVLKVATTPAVTQDSVSQHLSTHVRGKELPFDDATLRGFSDVDRVRKAYKVTVAQPSSSGKGKAGKDAVANGTVIDSTSTNIERQVLGLMALRGAT